MKPGGMGLCTHQFAPAPRRFVWGPPKLETTGDSLSPTLPLFFALSLLRSPPFPPPGLAHLPASPLGLPFHSTSAAAGSHPASPPPPARARNRLVPWCFSAVTASAAGRPLAALHAASAFFEVIFL
jgi:hypothetical protein